MSNSIIGPRCHSNGITGKGNPEVGVLILGIAPGRNEMDRGEPFVGESGRLLDSILRYVDWSRDDVYVTNLICQWNDEPTAGQLAACRPRLQQEIEQFKPRLIITMGKIATEQVLTGVLFGNAQGGIFWTPNVLNTTHNAYVLPTFHPAAILHGVSAFIHPIVRDLRKIRTALSWDDGAPLSHVEYNIAATEHDLQNFLNDMNHGFEVAIDIESAQGKDTDEMLDPFSDKLLCLAVSDGTNTLVVPEPLCHNVTDWRQDKLVWTGHNFNFDAMGLRRFLGAHLPIKEDTLLMSYALDERPGVHGLKFLAREYLGAGFYETEAHTQAKQRKGFDKVDPPILYEYNAKDAAYTARLAPILYDKMCDDNVTEQYIKLLLPAANVFHDMQYRGIKIDLDVLNALHLKWAPAWQQAEDELRALAISCGAPAPFNTRSDPQLKRLVFDILKLPPMPGKLTKKKHTPQLDKEVLESLEGLHPFIDALQSFKGLEHAVNDLLTIRDNIKLDGLLHSTTKQHGTVTGRTSMIDPALQQIRNPKYESNRRFKEFRDIFVPHNSQTHVILEADYSKAELWWAVTVTGDQAMLADLQSGDFHTLVAADIFRKPIAEVTKWDRTRSKHVTFGIMYGRGAEALAKGELKCTRQEAELFVARWKDRYHVYVAWTEAQKEVARKEGELVTYTGFKRRFKLIMPDDWKSLNEGVNVGIQNPASDTTKAAMIRLHPLLAPLDSYILVAIHDSLVFEVAIKHLTEVYALVHRIMGEAQFDGALPIDVELSIGPSWGETKEVTPDEYLTTLYAVA